MLSSSDLQRYARQVLIADVGRAGQELWLSAHLRAMGRGPALDAALELIRAAGPQVELRPELQASAEVRPDVRSEIGGLLLGPTAFADRRAACEACLDAFFAAQPDPPASEAGAVAFAVGAGAAAEVLLGLLDPHRPAIGMAFVPQARRVRVAREECGCRR
jgi:hypothetical protein